MPDRTLPQHWMRDEPRTRWCARWGRHVTRWHRHWGRAEVVAMPQIVRRDHA